MKVKDIKNFVNKYNDDDNIEFGIVNQETGQWFDSHIEFLCNKEEMGNDSIGIQFEENTDYLQEHSYELIESIREKVVSNIDKFVY